jgi:uncharacterized protein Yka (UPF0111/DUF47 family)
LRKYGLWKDLTFYFVLEAQAETAHRAAKELQALLTNPGTVKERTAAIEGLRQEADRLTQEFSKRLDSAFITPLDKEDLDALSTTFDDLLTAIEEAAAYALLLPGELQAKSKGVLGSLLVDTTQAIYEGAGGLRDKHNKPFLDVTVAKLFSLHRSARIAHRAILAELFGQELSSRDLLLGNNLVGRLGNVTEKSSIAAGWIKRLAVKYG